MASDSDSGITTRAEFEVNLVTFGSARSELNKVHQKITALLRAAQRPFEKGNAEIMERCAWDSSGPDIDAMFGVLWHAGLAIQKHGGGVRGAGARRLASRRKVSP